MSLIPNGRLKSWLRKIKASTNTSATAEDRSLSGFGPRVSEEDSEAQNPLYNYYKHLLDTDPTSFIRFALQSQSLLIRDVFAKAATYGRENLVELLAVLDGLAEHDPEQRGTAAETKVYDRSILLALGDLLANSARHDLDTHAALQIYDFVLTAYGDDSFDKQQRLQYLEALGEVGRYKDLDRLSKRFEISELAPLQYELLNVQRVAPTPSSSDRAWIDAMNELYDSLGMSPIQLIGDASIPLLDRLASNTEHLIDGPKVSVIVPTFSPSQGIWTAIRSLLEQTWQNLEIIVVDDASPQEYGEILSELERTDEKIRVVRQSRNSGAYVARNSGLALATGDYVTTHDDDDWSHPDKIARQVAVLDQGPDVIAVTASHIRTTPEMVFKRVNKRPVYLQLNYSSLMFRRTLIEEIGEWDTVNRSGDAEFLMRIISNFGAASISELSDQPLSFSRVWEGSLTSGEMARGFHANSRILYRWAFRQWQIAGTKAGGTVVRHRDSPRQFPIPSTFAPGQRNKDLGLFDVICVTDFFRQAKFVDIVLEQIEALYEQGFRVGYMHLPSPQTSKATGIPQRLFDLQLQGKIIQVSHDDVAETRLLAVYDSSIGMFLDQIKSSVASRRSIMIDHRLPSVRGGHGRTTTLVGQSLRHLDRCFKTTFEVVGATKGDQERLRHQVPSKRLLSDELTWHFHITEGPADIAVPGADPIVGFHSYGNRFRWPSNASTFDSVYISSNYETRFYGNTGPAVKKFGPQALAHINLMSIKDKEESEFLTEIDFWVYYPNDRLQDQIWRPVLSAMQAGKVVILPHRLETLYGAAAAYAKPEEVGMTISELTNDPEAYVSQAQRGQEFVASQYTAEHLANRICTLVGSDAHE